VSLSSGVGSLRLVGPSYTGPWSVPIVSSAMAPWTSGASCVTMFAYVCLELLGAIFCWGGVFFCLGVVVGFTLLGQSLRMCPTVEHWIQVAGEPDQETMTLLSSMLMMVLRVVLRLWSGMALTTASHLDVSHLVPLTTTGATSTGQHISASLRLMVDSSLFLSMIGTLSILKSMVDGSLPFGGRMGIL